MEMSRFIEAVKKDSVIYCVSRNGDLGAIKTSEYMRMTEPQMRNRRWFYDLTRAHAESVKIRARS
jgi:hypothetical protein